MTAEEETALKKTILELEADRKSLKDSMGKYADKAEFEAKLKTLTDELAAAKLELADLKKPPVSSETSDGMEWTGGFL